MELMPEQHNYVWIHSWFLGKILCTDKEWLEIITSGDYEEGSKTLEGHPDFATFGSVCPFFAKILRKWYVIDELKL